MARSMLELYGLGASHELGEPSIGELPYSSLLSREHFLTEAQEKPISCDIVVLGCDLATALTAHLLALNGVRVTVLSSGSFVQQRDSLLGAIVRSLALPPLKRLFKYRSIMKGAARLARYAPHRVTQVPVMYEVFRSDSLSLHRERAGLRIRTVPVADEVRLTHEALLGARTEGARCLSHALPIFCEFKAESDTYVVGFRDQFSERQYEIECGGVLVGTCYSLPPSRLHPAPDSSQVGGVDSPWTEKDSALRITFLGRAKAGVAARSGRCSASIITYGDSRNVMIVSQRDGSSTAMFPSECEIASLPLHLLELLSERYGEIVDVRRVTLGKETASPLIDLRGGVFRLAPDCCFQGSKIAEDVMRSVAQAAAIRDRDRVGIAQCRNPSVIPPLRALSLPAKAEFRSEAMKYGVSLQQLDLCEMRWGDRVKYIAQYPDGLSEVIPTVLKGEVLLARYCESALTVEDFLDGSLGLRVQTGWQKPTREEALKSLLGVSGSY